MIRPSVTTIQADPKALGDDASLAAFLNRMQTIIFSALSYLFNLPLSLGQNLQKNVALTTNATTINHGLGRPVQGVLMVRANAHATIITTDTATPATTINVTASAAVTGDLLFF